VLGDQVTARDLLRRGAARANDLAEHPEVQARLLDVIGQMYGHLGHYEEARRLLERAIAIRQDVLGPESPDLASSLIHLAWIHRIRGEHAEAIRLAGRALAIRRAVLPSDHPDIAEAVYQLGRATPDPKAAEALYREALELLEVSGRNPELRIGLLQGLSTFARRQGHGEAAIAWDRSALELAQQLFGPDDYRAGYAMVHLADHIRDILEDYGEAERLYREGMALISRRYGDNHTRLIHGLHSLAWLKSQLGEHAEAEALYRRSLAIQIAATGPETPSVAAELSKLAGGLERQGRLEEAEALVRQALDLWSRTLAPDHPATGPGFTQLAGIVFAQGRAEEADSLYRLAIVRQLSRPNGAVPAAETRRDYGRMLTRHGAFEAAEAALLQSLEALEGAYSPEHPNPIETRRALVELYEAWGKPERADGYRVGPGRFTAY
jgi:eukaryotic-like serine/threonine-protein kinase